MGWGGGGGVGVALWKSQCQLLRHGDSVSKSEGTFLFCSVAASHVVSVKLVPYCTINVIWNLTTFLIYLVVWLTVGAPL